MADISPATLRGILVPDPRLTYASGVVQASSSLNQRGPIAGVPVADTESAMILEAGGSPASDTGWHVIARSGGQPRPDGATFAWRNSTDSTSLWRGWDPPQAITAFESLDYTTTANKWQQPHVLRRQDDGLVCAVLRTSRYIRAWTRPASSTTWTENNVYDTGATVVFQASPCTLQLPTGRLLLFHWQEISATQNQIRMHYSDDGGLTWTLGQKNCLLTPLGTTSDTPGRLRCGYLNGEILLVASVLDTSGVQPRDRLVQYASDDLGATFTRVSSTSGYSAGGDLRSRAFGEVTVTGGRFLVTYLKERASGYGDIVPHRRFLGQAFEALSAAAEDIAVQTTNLMEWGAQAATQYFNNGELATWEDEDGVLWMAGLDFSDLRTGYAQRSTNGGLTWEMVGSGSGTGFGSMWWSGRDATTHPRGFSACAHQGRAVVLHTFAANPGTNDDSLCAVYLGGFTTVTLPNLAGEAVSSVNRVSWERTWLPYDLPDAAGSIWTGTIGGAPVIALDAGSLYYQGGAGDSANYEVTVAPPGTIAQGVLLLIDGLASTTSVGGGAFVTARVGDGANAYSVRVTFSNQKLLLRDLIGGVDLAELTTANAIAAGQNGVQILLHIYNPAGGGAGNTGRVRAWYRTAIPGTDSDREWTALGSSAALATGVFASTVAWGVLNGVATSARIRIQCFSSGSYAGEPAYDFANPNELLGRAFSSSLAYVDGGLRVRMVDGPAFRGDEVTITTDYSFPVRNVFPEISPSPGNAWKTANDTASVSLVLSFDSVLNQDTEFLGSSIGVYLGGINFQECVLQAAVAGGGLATIGVIAANTGQTGLGFTRRGDELTVGPTFPGNASSHWYTYNILKDSYVKLIRTGQEAQTVVRKILWNSEGAWRGDGATKTARLILEGVQATDPTGNMATDTCEFWSKDVLFIINDTTPYLRYALLITGAVGATYEGYFQMGNLVIGHVAWMGKRYSRGRVLELAPNTSLVTTRAGTRRAVSLGKARRSVQLGWVEGIDTSRVHVVQPTPDYVSASTAGPAVAAPADVPFLVPGLTEALRGSLTPVVYLPTFTRPSAASVDTTLVNRNRFLYSRVVTKVTTENVLGEEWAAPGEVLKVAQVTLEEEL